MKKIMAHILIVLLLAECLCGCDANSAKNAGDQELPYSGLTKVEDYLYEITFGDYDYASAQKYFEETVGDAEAFSCSACRSGSFVGRNYDWTYDEGVEFVTYVPAKEGRHASIGVSGCHSLLDLTKKVVEKGGASEDFALLPFFTRDGINDAGVYVNDNMVADGTMGQTTGTDPNGERICALMIPRFVLDHADSAAHAIELLKEKNIYMPGSEEYTDEIHFMIADAEETYVVEFINNELTVLKDEKIMTNFYLTGFDRTEQTLSDMPVGLERYNILRDNILLGATEDGMLELMQKVWFSHYYDTSTVPFWYTDYCGDWSDDKTELILTSADIGEPDLSKSLDGAGKFKECIEWEVKTFKKKKRDGEVWISCHTSVYDLENKTLSIIAQESGVARKFSLGGK